MRLNYVYDGSLCDTPLLTEAKPTGGDAGNQKRALKTVERRRQGVSKRMLMKGIAVPPEGHIQEHPRQKAPTVSSSRRTMHHLSTTVCFVIT